MPITVPIAAAVHIGVSLYPLPAVVLGAVRSAW